MKSLVELAHAVSAHCRPVRVVAAHRVGVGALRIEEPLAPLLERLAKFGGKGTNAMTRFVAAHFAQREMHLGHFDRKLAPFAETQCIDDVSRFGDEALGCVGIADFDDREGL